MLNKFLVERLKNNANFHPLGGDWYVFFYAP